MATGQIYSKRTNLFPSSRMLGSYKWSVLKVSSTAAGILIGFGSLWFVDPSTQLVGRQLAIFHILWDGSLWRSIWRTYGELCKLWNHKNTQSDTFNDGKWHVNGGETQNGLSYLGVTNGQISAWKFLMMSYTHFACSMVKVLDKRSHSKLVSSAFVVLFTPHKYNTYNIYNII